MASEVPTFTGWLKKDPGANPFGGRKRRFFVLTHDKCFYYQDENQQKLKGDFSVDSIIRAEPVKDRKFHVVTAGRTYKLEADNKETMEHWVRVYNEVAGLSNVSNNKSASLVVEEHQDIIPQKPEKYSGISIWLEIPDLLNIASEFRGSIVKHKPHITLLYGLPDEEHTFLVFDEFIKRIRLCFGYDWGSLRLKSTKFENTTSEELDMGFIDLTFQINKDLSEIYKMATDTFRCQQKIKTIPRPRCCVLYGDIKDRKVTDTRVLMGLNQKIIPPCGFGNITLVRTTGTPQEWEIIKSALPVDAEN